MKQIRFGIDKKIICLFSLLVILLGIILCFYFIKHEEEALLSEFDERAKALLGSLAASSEYPVLIKDTKLLASIIKGVLNQKDVLVCKIKDRDGRILFWEEKIRAEKYVKEYSIPILTKKSQLIMGEELILGTTKEEKTEEIGKVSLIFSLTNMKNKLYAAKRGITLITIISILFAFLVITLLIKYVLSTPIKKLLLGTEIVAQGNLNYQVPIKSRDEIGEFARSFNQMTQNLAKITTSRDELNKEVIERKRAEEEIIRYSKSLEESNYLKDLFNDILQHDIKNYLTGVSCSIELLNEDETESEKKEYLEQSAEGINKTFELINNAIKLSKLRSLMDIELKSLDLKTVIEEAIEDIKPLLEKAEMKIENNIIQPTYIAGNEIIKEVFANLISNAIKYAPQGKMIKIDREEIGEFWKIKVIDFGGGIEDADKEVIFERFLRKEKKKVQGTGLGLAIVKKIVEFHLGKIWVEDNPEGGAVFVIEIPKIK